ncbi:MAG: PBSX family phage terminase large subunit [Oscillospiraceae bacterium]
MSRLLSPKQAQALSLVKSGGLRRINILEGSVRSGKTWISMIMWGFWVAGAPQDGAYLMAGKTLTTLRRNVLEPMCGIFGGCFTYSLSRKEARLFGRKIYLEGASNAQAESKIRGMTLNGAYCDELSLFPEDFFAMLLSRLSAPGAKLIATTNPDNPGHWLKRNYLDNKSLSLLDLKFTLEDNTFLPPEYVNSLKAEFTGVFYDRFILGNWTAAEGRIYEDFSQKCVIQPEELHQRLAASPLVTSVIGVDYGGNKSASAFVHTGFDAGFQNVYVLSEHYDRRNSSAEALIAAFADYTAEEKQRFPVLAAACCDSAEQLLIKSFRSAVRLEVKNALKKQVTTRINMVNRLISAGRLHVSAECPHLIEALKSAVWDEKSIHKDVRLDDGSTNIDSLDAFEYSIERFERDLFHF